MSTRYSCAGPYQFVYYLIVVQFREMHVGYISERSFVGYGNIKTKILVT